MSLKVNDWVQLILEKFDKGILRLIQEVQTLKHESFLGHDTNYKDSFNISNFLLEELKAARVAFVQDNDLFKFKDVSRKAFQCAEQALQGGTLNSMKRYINSFNHKKPLQVSGYKGAFFKEPCIKADTARNVQKFKNEVEGFPEFNKSAAREGAS